jgi:acyl carrier protein
MMNEAADQVMDTQIEDRIRSAIVTCLKLKLDPRSIAVDLPLVEKGLGLDSVSILQLVGSIEEEFLITIDDTDIARDLFRDVRSLSDYVRGKLNGN